MFEVYSVLQRHWHNQRHPVYLEELRQQRQALGPAIRWRGWRRYGERFGLAVVIFIGLLSCRAGVVGAFVMLAIASMALLVGVAIVPYLWRIPVSLVTAPVVARERAGRTWPILAATPYSVRELLLAKYAAAINPLQGLLFYVIVVRLLISLPALAAGGYFLLRALGEPSLPTLTTGLLPFFCVAYFLFEPYQDFAIDGAVGLVASTFAPSAGQSFPLAIIVRLTLWLAQLLALIPALALLRGLGLDPRLLSQLPALLVMGPGIGYLTDWPFLALVILMGTFLLARTLWLNGLFMLAERRAGESA